MTYLQRLTLAFFDRPVAQVARDLLGKKLIHGSIESRILETEAYLNKDDLAAHYVQGKRRALEAYAKGPGTIYMHPMRGHWGIDLVAADGSVLLRAVSLAGANGPGKLTRALVIGEALHTRNVTDPGCPLGVFEGLPEGEIVTGPRVGISRSVALPLRFLLKKPSN